MSEPLMTALLLDYFEDFLHDQDAERFRRQVLGRYSEGTLARLAQSGPVPARRAAVFALGLVGGFSANAVVARSMRDSDPIVRNLAQNALWAIWFRADSPENNASLEQIRVLIGGERLDDAVAAASRLIERAPKFAEAYNQRAIANYHRGNYTESAADCQRVLARNPYHIGALSGLGKCHLELGRRDEALRVFHRLLELQPFDVELRDAIEFLEASK
jgi:tetratricopeptide (TPR) repeat protein